ncbi:MAG: HD domain-containing protein [Actinomycetota bacterium]
MSLPAGRGPEAGGNRNFEGHPLLEQVQRHEGVSTYLTLADQFLGEEGYTEHGFRHAKLVAHIAFNVLHLLGFEDHLAELAAVAGYLHDIGNVVSRDGHALSSAMVAFQIMTELGWPAEDIGQVLGAIGNHEEESGQAISPVAAAVILADKSDVHESRVRKAEHLEFDIHDRVNFATQRSFLRVDAEAKTLTLELEIDVSISQVIEYFEIFLDRMMMCRRAAKALGAQFHLTVNGNALL